VEIRKIIYAESLIVVLDDKIIRSLSLQ